MKELTQRDRSDHNNSTSFKYFISLLLHHHNGFFRSGVIVSFRSLLDNLWRSIVDQVTIGGVNITDSDIRELNIRVWVVGFNIPWSA